MSMVDGADGLVDVVLVVISVVTGMLVVGGACGVVGTSTIVVVILGVFDMGRIVILFCVLVGSFAGPVVVVALICEVVVGVAPVGVSVETVTGTSTEDIVGEALMTPLPPTGWFLRSRRNENDNSPSNSFA